VKITQVGISEVVYNQGYLVDTKTAEIFAESGVRLRQFSPPRNGLVDLSLLLPKDAMAGAKEGSTKPEDAREILSNEDFVRPIN
jgi:dCMP deaminase